jgi:hypothetical protein
VAKPCEQCDAILREYQIAYLDFLESADQETREACQAVVRLLECSEAAMQSVEDILPRFHPMSAAELNTVAFKEGVRYWRGADRIKGAILKKWLHQKATGHVVNLRVGEF